MLTDLKYALRQLFKSPGFTLTAIVTLALGIGANAIVFSVLNALILRPINVPHAENMFTVQRNGGPSQSYLDYKDLRDRNHTFDSLMLFKIMGAVGIDTGGNPGTAWPLLTSGNYFDGIGVQPYLGRFYHASDEKGMGSAPYVVLSYAWWHTQYHDDTSVIGRTLLVNKHPLTVIGVAQPDFRGTELFLAPAMWIPIIESKLITGEDGLEYRGNHSPWVLGRLKAGVTPAQATADLNGVAAWLAKSYPGDDEGLKISLAKPGLVGDFFGGPARAFMAGLMLLAGLILLAACANLGSLFAARTADRSKETALRLALGSSRKLILRQLITEALAVSLAGGAVGLAASIAILRGLSMWQPIPDVPINVPVNPDLRTYAVALVLAILSGLFFGLVPIRQVLDSDPWQMIRAGMSVGTGMRRITLRDVLLVAQIAICAVLVTASLVAIKGLVRSMHSQFGFNPDHVLLVSTDMQMAGYTGDNALPVQQRMLDAVRTIPGVSAAGYTNDLPLGLGGSDSYVYTDTTTDFRPTNYIVDSMYYEASPGYFGAAGTKLLAGRDLAQSDNKQTPLVAVINRAFAVKVFGSVEKAIGGHYKYWGGKRALVVGIVEDGRYRALTEDQKPAMFFSHLQQPDSGTWLVIRSQRDPADLTAEVQRTLHGVDGNLPLTIRTWNEELNTALFAARVATVALGVLGILGAMLAATGIFGMASYVVSKRLRELGIRVALGAGRQQVLRAALGRAFRLLALGSLVGLVADLLASHLLAAIVYQASAKDPTVLCAVLASMLLLGLIASMFPARKALSANPVALLREN